MKGELLGKWQDVNSFEYNVSGQVILLAAKAQLHPDGGPASYCGKGKISVAPLQGKVIVVRIMGSTHQPQVAAPTTRCQRPILTTGLLPPRRLPASMVDSVAPPLPVANLHI